MKKSAETGSQFLEIARNLAQQAALEIKKRVDSAEVQSRKADNSPVTEADLVADRIIREGLLQACPEHAILTEETGLVGKAGSTFTWCVDPLDGTKAFAKRIPGFCVMIGLLREGQPYLGVLVDPLENRVYEAVKGQGAFQIYQGKRDQLRVSPRIDLSEMPLVISTGFPSDALETLRQLLTGPLVPPINSVGIKVGLLVRQIGDIYLNHHSVSYWDTCAPQIILEEAGGKITKWDGSPLSYSLEAPFAHHAKTLASNGLQHSEIIQNLQGILA